jgi:hypothetical protein
MWVGRDLTRFDLNAEVFHIAGSAGCYADTRRRTWLEPARQAAFISFFLQDANHTTAWSATSDLVETKLHGMAARKSPAETVVLVVGKRLAVDGHGEGAAYAHRSRALVR